MTSAEKKQKIKERALNLLKQSIEAAEKNIDKALNCGAINIDEWDENSNPQILPKCIVVAILKEEADQHSAAGTSFEKQVKKEAKNIGLFI